MDKISDFIKELKGRLSSPLISSYIISWIVINWKVTIGILFYKISDLKLDGYTSFMDLVTKNVTVTTGVLLPTLVAFIYTFIYPLLRNCILAFNSWTKSWGDEWNLKIMKGSKIPMLKYIQLKENYQVQSKLLEETIEKESYFNTENKTLHQRISEITNTVDNLSAELKIWKSANDVNVIKGEWEFSLKQSLGDEKIINRLHIDGNSIQIFGNLKSESNAKLTIKGFYRSPYSNQLLILIESYKTDAGGGLTPTFRYQRLEAFDDMKLLRGVEDDMYDIEYKKV